MNCQFCTPTTGGHQPECPVLDTLHAHDAPLSCEDVDVRECTCQQMPHRADCMVMTGIRPAPTPADAVGSAGDACGCLAMLRGEVNAWLAEAAVVDGWTKDVFLGHALYFMSLLERAKDRHALQALLIASAPVVPDLKALLTRALHEYLSDLSDAGPELQAFCAEIKRAVA